jgi:hypothetical protein
MIAEATIAAQAQVNLADELKTRNLTRMTELDKRKVTSCLISKSKFFED